MRGYKQKPAIILRHQQGNMKEAGPAEIKRDPGRLIANGRDPFLALLRRHISQIDHHHLEIGLFHRLLKRLPIPFDEARAQNLVALDDLSKSRFDGRRLEDAANLPSNRNVERRISRTQLINNPAAQLSLRAREFANNFLFYVRLCGGAFNGTHNALSSPRRAPLRKSFSDGTRYCAVL
ncbi:hypothetical protein GGD56_005882 [Rhizobium mongolense]|uniref:Uncharacterized protein n=1 Tax=Rhizobium mongolense TaxID=57676 RepID=A0ABR6IVP8_9HYPH|nr:hypothetical protein [Rhizobium mongolense]